MVFSIIARRNDRWTTKVLYWILRNKKILKKRPHCSWRDEIVQFIRAECRTAEKRTE